MINALALLQTLCNSPKWPQLQSVSDSETGYNLNLFIQPNIEWLQGHFPQQPLVAGVVQTHWAGKLSEILFGVSGVKQIDNLKFQDVMLPEQSVQLTLEFNADNNSVKFRYQKPDQADQVFSEGKIQFKHHSAADQA